MNWSNKTERVGVAVGVGEREWIKNERMPFHCLGAASAHEVVMNVRTRRGKTFAMHDTVCAKEL